MVDVRNGHQPWTILVDVCSEYVVLNVCGGHLQWTFLLDLCKRLWKKFVLNIDEDCGEHVWRTIVDIYRYMSIRPFGSSSDRRCQVNVDGAQRRHDGQVKEGEASQLDLKWRPNRKRGHGEQCIQCLIDPAPFSVQYVPHWTETVLSVCVGWDRHGGGQNMNGETENKWWKDDEREERKSLVQKNLH